MPTLAPVVTPYYGGGQVINPADVISTSGAPSTANIQHRLGTLAVDNTAATIYGLASKSAGIATWIVLGGATGAVATINSLSPTAGNIVIAGTAGQVTATSAGSTVTLSTPAAFVAPGSVATNGNLILGVAGNKIISTSVATTTAAGANSFGTVTLSLGTATVATTAVTANSIIMLTRMSPGATGAAPLGMLSIGTITAGTSFVINALTTANSTTNVTSDLSSVGWIIIN